MLKKACSFSFSLIHKIPTVDIAPFLNYAQKNSGCQILLSALEDYGCALVKDPRVDTAKNNIFLDEMERYFTKRQEQFDRHESVDAYPQLKYQIGITPPNITWTKENEDFGLDFPEKHRPYTKYPLKPLSKLRYLWTIGEPGPHIQANIPPLDFPNFAAIMDDWGNSNMNTVFSLSQMLALALKLPKSTFELMLQNGGSKLAPNANDLRRCELWEPFTSLHYDLSFLTIHGRSRFPGLYVWLRNGEKTSVSIPDGHLLVQAGCQLEYLTAGRIHRGYHQAINTPLVCELGKKAASEGRIPWRITSTTFTHIRQDVIIRPLSQLSTPDVERLYPPISQSEYFKKELSYNRF